MLGLVLSLNLGCGDDGSDPELAGTANDPTAQAPPDAAQGPSEGAEATLGDAPQLGATRVVAHDAKELQAAGALAQARSLDLALSLVDARTRPLDPDAPLPESINAPVSTS